MVGLDETWAQTEETLATAGAGASSATTTTFIRVFRGNVVNCGSYTTPYNAAQMTIEASDGSADLAVIPATLGQTLQAVWTVPAGKIAYVKALSGSSDATKAATWYLIQRQNADDVTGPSYTSRRVAYVVAGLSGPFRHDLQVYLGPFPAKTDLYVVGVGPTGGSAMSAEFAVVLIDA